MSTNFMIKFSFTVCAILVLFLIVQFIRIMDGGHGTPPAFENTNPNDAVQGVKGN